MYTEATTKDGNQGIMVKAGTVSEILGECVKWIKDNGLEASSIEPTALRLCGDENTAIGTITFTDEGAVCVLN